MPSSGYSVSPGAGTGPARWDLGASCRGRVIKVGVSYRLQGKVRPPRPLGHETPPPLL